jgi:hypothetical protein
MMRNLRTWVAWSIAAGGLLVSPVLAFLMIIAAEMAVDGLMEAGVAEVCAIAIGVVGCVLFHRILRSEIAQLSEAKEVCGAPPIAAPPG